MEVFALDFYLSSIRSIKAAKRFLGKQSNRLNLGCTPVLLIKTKRAPAFGPAIDELKKEGKCPKNTVHWQVKYLNNMIEADHGKIKRLINPVCGFKTMKTAYATIKGVELMHMFNKEQMDAWIYGRGLIGGINLIEKQFDICIV